jgi:surface antigen
MRKNFFSRSPAVFLFLLATTILVSACSGTHSDYRGNVSTASGYVDTDHPLGMLFNIVKYSAYSLSRKDQNKHEQCIYFSLDNLYVGEKCDWYSNNGSTHGVVKVVAHQVNRTGSCTTMFNAVFHRGNWANWQLKACQDDDSSWNFVRN